MFDAALAVLAAAIAGGPILESRDILPVHVIVPRAEAPWIARREDMIRALRVALEPHVRARVVGASELADLRASECELAVNLACWIDAVRGEDRRVTIERRHFLLITIQETGLTTALAIDTEVALDAARRVDRSEERWRENVEDAIFATVGRHTETLDPNAMAAWAERVRDAARPLYEKRGDWIPTGMIVVRADHPHLAVTLDKVRAGATVSGETRIAEVIAGSYALSIADPSGELLPFETKIDVSAGGVTEVHATFVRAPSAFRVAVRWAGIGAGVAGAAVLGYAIAAPRDGYRARICRGGSCEDGLPFASTDDYSPPDGTTYESRGVMLAPLGYSAMIAGAAWFAGTTLFGADDDEPWIPLAIGVAAGALGYGLSAALAP